MLVTQPQSDWELSPQLLDRKFDGARFTCSLIEFNNNQLIA